MEQTLKDVETWAIRNEERLDTLRSLRRLPARLGLIDADLATLPADPLRFEHEIAGRGYALVSRAKDVAAAGRREDSRVRALLKRFHAAQAGVPSHDIAVRARYDALMQLIAAQEGQPGSGKRWNIGGIAACAACAPGPVWPRKSSPRTRSTASGAR